MRGASLSRAAAFLLTALCACSGSGTITIDVDLPLNQTSPFVELTQSQGTIFFVFDALLANANSINDIDTSRASIQIPSAPPFLQANKESYDLSELTLEDGVNYRVSMFGTLDPTNSISKYKGVGDCPLNPGGGSTVQVCFGLNGTTAPFCAKSITFANCTK